MGKQGANQISVMKTRRLKEHLAIHRETIAQLKAEIAKLKRENRRLKTKS